jgi:hypothetical protein
VFGEFEPKISFYYLNDLSFEELDAAVEKLGKGIIVFLFIYSNDRNGQVFSHEDNLRRMAPHCRVPIYAVWEFYLGNGIVGGKFTNGFDEGRLVSQMALKIINGEDASGIPIGQSPTRVMLDFNQIARFGIRESALPPNATVINRPTGFYHKYKYIIWSVAVLISILGALVMILGINVVKRQRAEKALKIK